jgi:hypothetical protein
MTKGFVLIMELRCNLLLGVSIKRLNPMEKTCSLFVNHFHSRISNPINNLNCIPVCLCTICHEPLENGRTQPFILNNCIQLFPQNTLSFRVLRLHVIDRNCHDLTIDQLISVIGHGCPSLNMLYMIEHHPHIFQIITAKSNMKTTPSMDILNK